MITTVLEHIPTMLKKHGQGFIETSFPKSSVLNLEFADLVIAVGLWTTLNGLQKG